MALSGNWILHYSWGCTSNYGQVSITFNPDGTFSGGIAGNWHQREGTVILTFTSGPAVYGGTVNGNVGSGGMSTFTGSEGCWYLSLVGIVGATEAAASTQTMDAAGGAGQSTGQSSGGFDPAGNPA